MKFSLKLVSVVDDGREEGGSTYCHNCAERLISRDWHVLSDWNLTVDGRCGFCNTPCAGVFEGPPGTWGVRRLPARLGDFAQG